MSVLVVGFRFVLNLVSVLILVTGLPGAFAAGDAVLLEEAWTASYDGPGGGWDAVKAIAADEQGNVYVACATTTKDGRAVLTLKYDSHGRESWGAFEEMRYAAGLALDPEQNVVVFGSSWEGGTGHTVTVKRDPYGNGGPGSGSSPRAVADHCLQPVQCPRDRYGQRNAATETGGGQWSLAALSLRSGAGACERKPVPT